MFVVLVLFGTAPVNAKNPLNEEQALNVLVTRVQKDKLYNSWITLACLSFITEEYTKRYFDFAIHEKHGGKWRKSQRIGKDTNP